MTSKKTSKETGTRTKAGAGKSGGKSGQGKGSPDPAPETGQLDEEPGEFDNYNLVALEAALGAVEESEIWDYVAGYDRKALVAMGTDVASSRVITDCQRDYGRAASFLQRATPEQQTLLSENIGHLLRAGVSAALRCEVTAREFDGGKSASAARQDEARQVFKTVTVRGRAMRQVAQAKLQIAIAGDSALLKALDNAHSTASSAEELALSLRNLAKLGRRLLRSKDAAMARRLATAGVHDALLSEMESLADEVERAGAAAASVRTAPPVSQSDVDLWDGISLVLYGYVKDLFEAARALDPGIPRLVPMALRGYFGRPVRRRRKPADNPAGDPAEK